MKEKLRNNILYLLAFLMVITLGSCKQGAEEHTGESTNTSSGHDGEQVVITDDLEFLLEPTNTTVISNVSTISPQEKAVQTSVEMEGIITYDPRRIFTIPARVGGRIEQLFVKYNYQPISKGEKLMEVYSPELITAQKELLYLVQSAPEDTQLIAAAKQKLRLLGATDAQISRLIRTGEASYTFAIYSPYDGYVIGLNATAPVASAGTVSGASPAGAGSGMNGMRSSGGAGYASPATTAPTAVGEDIQLREGMYVSTGQPLMRVVNAEQLWAEFNIPAGEVSSIAKGAPVQITFPQLPSEKLEAKVDFFQPFFEAGENFAKVRVYLPGQQKLAMVGQLVTGKASYTTTPALWVPKAAVVDIGTRSVVFRKTRRVFEPVAVTVGATEGDEVQIVEGLQQNDLIAANAQFLVDSESFIKINK